jgi:hypothetical protein
MSGILSKLAASFFRADNAASMLLDIGLNTAVMV